MTPSALQEANGVRARISIVGPLLRHVGKAVLSNREEPKAVNGRGLAGSA